MSHDPQMHMTPTGEDLIGQYLHHLRQRRRTAATIDTYSGILHRAQRDIPNGLVGDIDVAGRDDLEKWLDCETWSVSTQRLYMIAIAGFFAWLVRVGEIHPDQNPTTGFELPDALRREPRPATTEQVTTILTHARQPIRLLSQIAARAGLRAIEIARLTREDITPDVIYVVGKGGHSRAVPTHSDLWAQVRDLPPGAITDLDRRKISARTRHEYHRIRAYTHIHALRGWFASELRRAGVDVRVIQVLLGHSSLATTQAYLGISQSDLSAAVDRLPALPGPAVEAPDE